MLVLFVLFAWLTPWDAVLAVHLCLVPLMQVQWWLNNDTCLLTNLERFLLNKPQEAPGDFVKSLLSLFLSDLPSDHALKLGIYIVTWGAWLLYLASWINS